MVADQPVDLINVNGGYTRGHLYYPYTVESLDVETTFLDDGRATERQVQSYKVRVLRSDGKVLDILRLPAPRGTPRDRQVLALTDGTRVEREPPINMRQTWPLEHIKLFIKRRQDGEPVARPFAEIIRDLRAHFSSAVWLPYAQDYTVLALYAAMTYVYNVFNAIPLMLVNGPKNTGKSELGDALDSVSFNSILCGKTSAASAVRAANDTRGLLILDDLEQVGKALENEAFNDINQILKLSYKKKTGKKLVTDKNGRIVEFDFYGPKVVNNTTGIDPITATRMYHVRTRQIPADTARAHHIFGYDPERAAALRAELHAWAMASARVLETLYKDMSGAKTERSDEIALPLRVLARLSADPQVEATLEEALDRQRRQAIDDDEPVELLREAAIQCVRQGAHQEVSLTQVCLELRRTSESGAIDQFPNGKPIWQQSWWISNQLGSNHIKEDLIPVGRRRLFGNLTKIFTLHREFVQQVRASDGAGPLPSYSDVFDFCTSVPCDACPYEAFCHDTVPGLRQAKLRAGGKHR